MSRKVYIEVKTRIIIDMDEGIEVAEVVSEMDYNFASTTTGAVVVDTEITSHKVLDSK